MSARDLRTVLESGNCSGCGACVLTGAARGMTLDAAGYLRPVPGTDEASESPRPNRPPLDTYCPALTVDRPSVPGAHIDPDFGPHLGVWAAHAADPEVRLAGSSGGVLTALSQFLLESGEAAEVAMVRAGEGMTSEGFAATTADEALTGAASRYAPVSSLVMLADASHATGAVVAKPCEAAALRRLHPESAGAPVIMSFFCAGVPSQSATEALVAELGADPGDVGSVRYRGNGWPGQFVAIDSAGRTFSTGYDESWGSHLGPTVQPRCKICVDGVGESADIVAADLWEADERGYPLFDEADGQSLLIARTPRGRRIVEEAIRMGVLDVMATDLEQARIIQPLQVGRRRFLAGRLLGRRLAGRRIPRYRGFALLSLAAKDPRGSLKQARGSFTRARRA